MQIKPTTHNSADTSGIQNKNNTKFNLKWIILKNCKSYSNLINRCNLCSYEKYVILKQPELSTLNKRKERSVRIPC